ncbi:hypothetical protein HY732_00700 [Candidatus Uhrbacteria bacterium]|nr:hypothetical protein [Candidatus Uhrbacteria bacterium]
MICTSDIRQWMLGHWPLFIGSVFLLLGIGIIKDELLIPIGGVGILVAAAYYGVVTSSGGWRTCGAFSFQPVLATASSSILLLFLEEPAFKALLLFALVGLHALFLFHLRYSFGKHAVDMRDTMSDTMRIFSQVNMFLLALIFFAPLFYYNIRYALFYVFPYVFLAAAIFSSCAWAEKIPLPRAMLYTAVFLCVLLEVTLAQLWLPSSYAVQALVSVIAFFLFTDSIIFMKDAAPRSVKERAISFLICILMIVWIVALAQWR